MITPPNYPLPVARPPPSGAKVFFALNRRLRNEARVFSIPKKWAWSEATGLSYSLQADNSVAWRGVILNPNHVSEDLTHTSDTCVVVDELLMMRVKALPQLGAYTWETSMTIDSSGENKSHPVIAPPHILWASQPTLLVMYGAGKVCRQSINND